MIAIQDFHALGLMAWTAMSVPEYLYGLRQSEREGEELSETISHHRWGTKEIPSNFFAQPESEHVSAVVANPSGTIAKFKRIGWLTGFGDRDLTIYRRGIAFSGEEAIPRSFSVEVTGKEYDETWCQGLAVYHNPNAAVPLPLEALPGAGHFTVEDGWLVSKLPEFFPLGSQTFTLVPQGANAESSERDKSADD